MKTIKVCNCCNNEFNKIPENAKYSDDKELGGAYWNCDCGSTMFIPNKKLVTHDGYIKKSNRGQGLVMALTLLLTIVSACSSVPKKTLYEVCKEDYSRYGTLENCISEKKNERLVEEIESQNATLQYMNSQQIYDSVSNSFKR